MAAISLIILLSISTSEQHRKIALDNIHVFVGAMNVKTVFPTFYVAFCASNLGFRNGRHFFYIYRQTPDWQITRRLL